VREKRSMRTAANLIKQLKSDEDGASLVEYTVLLGILLVAVFAIIAAVASWINNQWSTLNSSV
jgi:pilus assembly protein Flp/PilA